MIAFDLPPLREAHEPPEARGLARDAVRLMVSEKDGESSTRNGSRATPHTVGENAGGPATHAVGRHGGGSITRTVGENGGGAITHHAFTDLPGLLDPGDVLVVNDSATLPAAVPLDRLAVHFSTEREDGSWLVELRRRTRGTTAPYAGGEPGEWLPLPGGATLRLLERETPRLWRATLDRDVPAYLGTHGVPIRYAYVGHDWPLSDYQTVFGVRPGSAEMPSAGRPFSHELVTALVSRGVVIAPITLHTGVASPEKDEPPYPERFAVPASTARLVAQAEGRVIAVGTTVVRALETAAAGGGVVRPAEGWTSHIVTPATGVRAVDGLITGLHEPRSSHLLMLSAIAGEDLLARSYEEALREGYLWHEFGDLHMITPRRFP